MCGTSRFPRQFVSGRGEGIGRAERIPDPVGIIKLPCLLESLPRWRELRKGSDCSRDDTGREARTSEPVEVIRCGYDVVSVCKSVRRAAQLS